MEYVNLPVYIIDNLTMQTAVSSFHWVFKSEDISTITIDLTNPENHKLFIKQILKIINDFNHNKIYHKNIIIGYLNKNFTKDKKTYFIYNKQYDIISLLLKYKLLKNIGNNSFLITPKSLQYSERFCIFEDM